MALILMPTHHRRRCSTGPAARAAIRGAQFSPGINVMIFFKHFRQKIRRKIAFLT
jgi:hypothetical protein